MSTLIAENSSVEGSEMIELLKIDHVKTPQLDWSCRSRGVFAPKFLVNHHNRAGDARAKSKMTDVDDDVHSMASLSVEH